MQPDTSKMPEEELLAIIRRHENSHVPGSLYQRAAKELELRDRDKIAGKTGSQSGIFLRVGGDMIMKGGAIKTDPGSVIDVAVAGQYMSEDAMIDQTSTPDVLTRNIEEPLFKPEQPSLVGYVAWLLAFPRNLDKTLGRKVKSRLVRWVVYVVVMAMVALILIKIVHPFFVPDGFFRYTPFGTSFAAREAKVPTVIDVWFEGDVTNVSSEPMYLQNLHYVLWRNENLGRVWNEGYGLGTFYIVDGDARATTTMPLLFQANESKRIAWMRDIDVSDEETYMAYAERTGKGDFTWNKNTPVILTEDTRRNIFDAEGYLVSQNVIDAWWLYPNNRTLKEKIIASTDIAWKILIWKVQRLLALTS